MTEKEVRFLITIIVVAIIFLALIIAIDSVLANWYNYQVKILFLENAKEVANNLIDIFK